jgi:hypothetical protein
LTRIVCAIWPIQFDFTSFAKALSIVEGLLDDIADAGETN